MNGGILKLLGSINDFYNLENTLSPEQKEIKKQMCELFDLSDPEIRRILDSGRKEYPNVEIFIRGIFDFDLCNAMIPWLSLYYFGNNWYNQKCTIDLRYSLVWLTISIEKKMGYNESKLA